MRHPILKIALLFVFLAQVACSEETTADAPATRRFGSENFDIGVCQNDPFSGDDFATKSFENPITTSEYFGKTFFQNQLSNALPASSYTIAKNLHNDGVDIFQVKTETEKNCRYFDFLQTPNAKAQDKWDKANIGSSGQSFLLGLFTTTYRKNLATGDTEMGQPTIMLLDKTQKWTLLHEMSHYLFAKARTSVKDLKFNSDLEKEASDLKATIEERKTLLKEGGNKQLALELVTFYMDFFNTNHELDVRTALEEFSIESMLLEYASNEMISGIENTNDASNAYRYMLSNSLQVLSSYRRFLFELDSTKDTIFNTKWPVATEALEVLETRVERVIHFIELKIETAQMQRETQPSDEDEEELEKISAEAFSTGQHHQSHDHPVEGHYDIEKFQNRHDSLFNWN